MNEGHNDTPRLWSASGTLHDRRGMIWHEYGEKPMHTLPRSVASK